MELAERIYAGDIAPRPVGTGNDSPCTFCAGVSACGLLKRTVGTAGPDAPATWEQLALISREQEAEAADDPWEKSE